LVVVRVFGVIGSNIARPIPEKYVYPADTKMHSVHLALTDLPYTLVKAAYWVCAVPNGVC